MLRRCARDIRFTDPSAQQMENLLVVRPAGVTLPGPVLSRAPVLSNYARTGITRLSVKY